ncbi:hypothetical protein C1646_766763 [Rhizophagus diaphanus]|nr:hypothetical protein C1646_766763 [Rhizophagus diaphanus] [Rhizophagus sp. MUCL 43196]
MSNSEEIPTETLESTKDPESYQDEIVGDKEIPELGPCSECTNNILSLPIKALTILSCGHIFHRLCIEKQLFYTKPSICPYPDCGKNVDIIVDPNSPVIPEDPMEGVEASSTTQKRSSGLSESTRQSSSKKQKTTTNDGDSPTLKRLIKELKIPSSASTDIQPLIANPGSLTELYEAIITAEDKNRATNQEIIKKYYSFGEELEKIFDRFKSSYRDRKAQRLLVKEVTKQLPVISGMIRYN